MGGDFLKIFLKSTSLAVGVASIFIIAYSLLCSDAGAKGAFIGMETAVNSVLPGLFPMMILSSLAMNTAVNKPLAFIFSPITSYLMAVPKKYGNIVIFSLIGGYTVGANLIGEALEREEMDENTASRLLCISVNPGIGYTVAVVGATMLKSRQAGWILFFSQLLSVIITARLCAIPKNHINSKALPKTLPFAKALTTGIGSSIYGMINIIAFMGCFSSLIYLLNDLGVIKNLSIFFSTLLSSPLMDYTLFYSFISGFFEVASGCVAALGINRALLLPTLSFILSFGGLSVMAQVYTLVRRDIPMMPFILSRITQAFLSAAIAVMLGGIFGGALPVFSSATPPIMHFDSSTLLITLCMLSMCSMLLFSASLSISEFNRQLIAKNR